MSHQTSKGKAQTKPVYSALPRYHTNISFSCIKNVDSNVNDYNSYYILLISLSHKTFNTNTIALCKEVTKTVGYQSSISWTPICMTSLHSLISRSQSSKYTTPEDMWYFEYKLKHQGIVIFLWLHSKRYGSSCCTAFDFVIFLKFNSLLVAALWVFTVRQNKLWWK